MSILNKYKKWKSNLLLNKSRYYDFVLSLDNTKSIPINGELTKHCLISYIDSEDENTTMDDISVISKSGFTYEYSVNDNVRVENIGLTGIDNGTVLFNGGIKDNDTLIKVINSAILFTEQTENHLYLKKASSNVNKYSYPINLIFDGEHRYFALNGGFLQGFYKLYGYNYEILPQYIQNAWSLEFVIRPRTDYIKESGMTLNDTHDNNDGIFFYIGTRAENKFAQFYDKEKHDDEYTVITSENHIADSDVYEDIITDNAYLIYNRTKDGYTTKNFTQGDYIQVSEKKKYNENLYLLLNRTKSGYTTEDIDEYLSATTKSDKCNTINDITNNAFALRIKDGKIGYRYAVKDCDSESGFSICEEYTKFNVIKENEWNVVNIVFKIINGNTDDCGIPVYQRKMILYVYVNGYLKLVSKELPELNIRELNDYYDKQEGVPFNISLGGGTQGLSESIWFDNFSGSTKMYEIEKNFAGTFIGDIRSFKFYNCQLEYNEIKNNYLYEMNGKIEEDIIKDNVIYYGFGLNEDDVINNGNKMNSNSNSFIRLNCVSNNDNTNFYLIISKKYNGCIPQEFTCGGAPMSISKEIKVVQKTECIIFKSNAIYGKGTELSILVNNV